MSLLESKNYIDDSLELDLWDYESGEDFDDGDENEKNWISWIDDIDKMISLFCGWEKTKEECYVYFKWRMNECLWNNDFGVAMGYLSAIVWTYSYSPSQFGASLQDEMLLIGWWWTGMDSKFIWMWNFLAYGNGVWDEYFDFLKIIIDSYDGCKNFLESFGISALLKTLVGEVWEKYDEWQQKEIYVMFWNIFEDMVNEGYNFDDVFALSLFLDDNIGDLWEEQKQKFILQKGIFKEKYYDKEVTIEQINQYQPKCLSELLAFSGLSNITHIIGSYNVKNEEFVDVDAYVFDQEAFVVDGFSVEVIEDKIDICLQYCKDEENRKYRMGKLLCEWLIVGMPGWLFDDKIIEWRKNERDEFEEMEYWRTGQIFSWVEWAEVYGEDIDMQNESFDEKLEELEIWKNRFAYDIVMKSKIPDGQIWLMEGYMWVDKLFSDEFYVKTLMWLNPVVSGEYKNLSIQNDWIYLVPWITISKDAPVAGSENTYQSEFEKCKTQEELSKRFLELNIITYQSSLSDWSFDQIQKDIGDWSIEQLENECLRLYCLHMILVHHSKLFDDVQFGELKKLSVDDVVKKYMYIEYLQILEEEYWEDSQRYVGAKEFLNKSRDPQDYPIWSPQDHLEYCLLKSVCYNLYDEYLYSDIDFGDFVGLNKNVIFDLMFYQLEELYPKMKLVKINSNLDGKIKENKEDRKEKLEGKEITWSILQWMMENREKYGFDVESPVWRDKDNWEYTYQKKPIVGQTNYYVIEKNIGKVWDWFGMHNDSSVYALLKFVKNNKNKKLEWIPEVRLYWLSTEKAETMMVELIWYLMDLYGMKKFDWQLLNAFNKYNEYLLLTCVDIDNVTALGLESNSLKIFSNPYPTQEVIDQLVNVKLLFLKMREANSSEHGKIWNNITDINAEIGKMPSHSRISEIQFTWLGYYDWQNKNNVMWMIEETIDFVALKEKYPNLEKVLFSFEHGGEENEFWFIIETGTGELWWDGWSWWWNGMFDRESYIKNNEKSYSAGKPQNSKLSKKKEWEWNGGLWSSATVPLGESLDEIQLNNRWWKNGNKLDNENLEKSKESPYVLPEWAVYFRENVFSDVDVRWKYSKNEDELDDGFKKVKNLDQWVTDRQKGMWYYYNVNVTADKEFVIPLPIGIKVYEIVARDEQSTVSDISIFENEQWICMIKNTWRFDQNLKLQLYYDQTKINDQPQSYHNEQFLWDFVNKPNVELFTLKDFQWLMLAKNNIFDIYVDGNEKIDDVDMIAQNIKYYIQTESFYCLDDNVSDYYESWDTELDFHIHGVIVTPQKKYKREQYNYFDQIEKRTFKIKNWLWKNMMLVDCDLANVYAVWLLRDCWISARLVTGYYELWPEKHWRVEYWDWKKWNILDCTPEGGEGKTINNITDEYIDKLMSWR